MPSSPNSHHHNLHTYPLSPSEHEAQQQRPVVEYDDEEDEEEPTALYMDQEEPTDDEGFFLPLQIQGASLPPSLTGPRRRRRRGRSWPPFLTVADEDEVEVLGFAAAVRGGAGGGGEGAGCLGTPSGVEEDRSVFPTCPICMERWTSEGVHRVCCIPCGHVYGRSCLLKWAKHCGRNPPKCPQCNIKFKQKQIVNLYAPLIAVASDDLEKEVSYLRGQNDSLLLENSHLLEEVHKHKMRIVQLENSDRQEKACRAYYSIEAMHQSPPVHSSGIQKSLRQPFFQPMLSPQSSAEDGSIGCSFVLQFESEIDEARVLDIDVSNQMLMISRTVPTLGSGHAITKISLFIPNEMENVLLPPSIGVVKDLHVAHFGATCPGRLSLLASLGKKLSIFSAESNSVVLQYDLPGSAWSCSWDINNPSFAYAGLQDGKLMVFDIRQTARPLRSQPGPSGHPIHTIHSVTKSHGLDSGTLFTASSVGTCLWDGNSVGEWPVLIRGMESYGVCIGLACATSTNYMVASFRPKVEALRNNISSQFSQPCSPITGHGKVGTHVLLKQRYGNNFEKCQHSPGIVSEVRMPKSAIFAANGDSNHLFAYGDEASRGLCIWEIPSFNVFRHLKPHQHPILDVKSSCSSGRGLLACISKSKLQVFAFSDLETV